MEYYGLVGLGPVIGPEPAVSSDEVEHAREKMLATALVWPGQDEPPRR